MGCIGRVNFLLTTKEKRNRTAIFHNRTKPMLFLEVFYNLDI